MIWLRTGNIQPIETEESKPMKDKILEALDNMEECTKVTEIESKSWHDFWVVQRNLVRCMWLVLTWIVKEMDRKR